MYTCILHIQIKQVIDCENINDHHIDITKQVWNVMELNGMDYIMCVVAGEDRLGILDLAASGVVENDAVVVGHDVD